MERERKAERKGKAAPGSPTKRLRQCCSLLLDTAEQSSLLHSNYQGPVGGGWTKQAGGLQRRLLRPGLHDPPTPSSHTQSFPPHCAWSDSPLRLHAPREGVLSALPFSMIGFDHFLSHIPFQVEGTQGWAEAGARGQSRIKNERQTGEILLRSVEYILCKSLGLLSSHRW